MMGQKKSKNSIYVFHATTKTKEPKSVLKLVNSAENIFL